jgi:hypothetical protein
MDKGQGAGGFRCEGRSVQGKPKAMLHEEAFEAHLAGYDLRILEK